MDNESVSSRRWKTATGQHFIYLGDLGWILRIAIFGVTDGTKLHYITHFYARIMDKFYRITTNIL
jgi:hypothetical protein